MGQSRRFQAAFVSAGGYHHHIGLNTWQGSGAPPPPDGAAGLRYFSVRLLGPQVLAQLSARLAAAGTPVKGTEAGLLLHDPSKNGVLLTVNRNQEFVKSPGECWKSSLVDILSGEKFWQRREIRDCGYTNYEAEARSSFCLIT